MQEIIKNIYYAFFKEELIQKVIVKEECPKPVKTSGEKLLEFALTFYNSDPTPKDEVDDSVSCVFSLTTILNKFLDGNFPIKDYTPDLVKVLQSDKRFKSSIEFKKGNVVIFSTRTGNGKIMGHCFICDENGKMLSNSSKTGLWTDAFNTSTMIERYSRVGQLEMFIFELL